jgi:hypothetical protein
MVKIMAPWHNHGRDSSVDIAVRGSNPGGGEIFRTRLDRPWGPPRLLYNGYCVFSGGKAAGVWCWPHTPFYRRDHERVNLYLHRPSGPVQACNGTALSLLSITLRLLHIWRHTMKQRHTQNIQWRSWWPQSLGHEDVLLLQSCYYSSC